jgi:hypothetical protein
MCYTLSKKCKSLVYPLQTKQKKNVARIVLDQRLNQRHNERNGSLEFRQRPNSGTIWTTSSNFHHCRKSYGITTEFVFAGNFFVYFPSEFGQRV